MKRARSVEAISRTLLDDNHHHQQHVPEKPKRESMHEDMLLICSPDERNGNVVDNGFNTNQVISQRVNRPKRIQAVVSEKDRPPVDVVKQTKRMFEGKPEQRTRQPHLTGDVAAKVASYKSIIVQSRAKPPIKQKPPVPSVNGNAVKSSKLAINTTNNGWISSSKSKTPSPDVAPLTSPVPDVSRVTSETPGQVQNGSSLCETPDLILHSSPSKVSSPTFRILATDNFLRAEISHSNKSERVVHVTATDGLSDLVLTPQELEKNLINSAKTLELSNPVQKCNHEDVRSVEPAPKPRRLNRELEQNSVVFKFTDRKDVPDYVCNDGIVRTVKLEKPKVSYSCKDVYDELM